MKNITISETELLQLLEKAYEEGWYGSKDMGETVAQRMVTDIKEPEYVESGGLTKKLLHEAENYYSNGENPLAGGHPAPQSTPADHGDMLNYGWTVNAAAQMPVIGAGQIEINYEC